jgi:serine/threonine protein phosphatase PrpC
MTETGHDTWRLIGCSVRGASHIRSGKPNQDRIKFSDNQATQPPHILAVADGHGSKPYFRSDKGAEFAVEIAIEVCKGLEQFTWETIKDQKIVDLLCRDIVQKWLERVNSDIQSNPFTEEENTILETKKEQITKRPGKHNTEGFIAYGSTLIITVIHNTFTLYLQLGDGNILLVSVNGDIDKPLPKDDRLFGNETTSLCLPESWSDFRFRLLPVDQENQFPALIIISTDGYANSYSHDDEFEKVGKDLLEIICECTNGIQEGIDSIRASLPDWLNTASEKGSGDDTTVGIICNFGQIKKYRDENYDVSIKKKIKVSSLPEILTGNESSVHSTEVIIEKSKEPPTPSGPFKDSSGEDNSEIDIL